RAEKSARSAAINVQARLMSELDQVRNAMADAAGGGGDMALVRTMATRIESSRALVRRVYVFMNPWGFVWPADAAADQAEMEERQALLETLRTLAASSSSASEPLGFKLGDNAYVFGPSEGRKSLYVGFAVTPGAFAPLLANALRDAGGGGVLLGAEGDGIHLPAGMGRDAGHVVVQDSLGGRRVWDADEAVRSLPRAVQHLAPPMDDVRILAYTENLDEVRRTVAVRNQLYRWGLVLLALGIVGGAGLLLSRARAEVQQARSGSDVALGVSHDLRTPIASMKMLAESILLGHVPNPARQQEFLRTIVEECERLSQLTERVLFLFRFGQDAMQYRVQPADLTCIVRTTVDAFLSRYVAGGLTSGAAPAPDVTVHTDVAPPNVRLDETAFRQVLLNLLDNAAKYGKTVAGAAVRIEVRIGHCVRRKAWRGGRRAWATVTVRDYGAGIPRRYQRRIFQRFYRVPEARDVNVSGVGLGLSVCRHVLLAHGGWIAVKSAPGEGAAFTLFVPTV
ncbi:MAG: HAMP domain-containing sensor histidine kinase, partial [Verrucomicrobia bacterium]|nr:HAMP domain-containing sensor histidine kinase [Verrucomicrobiota bacterium]